MLDVGLVDEAARKSRLRQISQVEENGEGQEEDS